MDGQLCYQIDINEIIQNKTATALQKGLSLLVDTNAEYDLTRLDGKPPEEEIFEDFTEEFFETEEYNIMIHIETISKSFPIYFLTRVLDFHYSSASQCCYAMP